MIYLVYVWSLYQDRPTSGDQTIDDYHLLKGQSILGFIQHIRQTLISGVQDWSNVGS